MSFGFVLSDGLFGWLAESSLQIVVLTAIVLVLDGAMWRALSPRARMALWALVLLRGLLPSLPQSRFEVPRLLDLPGRAAPGTEVVPELPVLPRPAIPPAQGATAKKSAPKEHSVAARATNAEVPIRAQPNESNPIENAPEVQSPPEPVPLSHWLLGLWAAGLVLTLAGATIREWRFRRRLSSIDRVREGASLSEVAALAHAIGIHREIEVYETDFVAGPASAGIFRPRVLLPSGFFEQYSPEARRGILLHELSHIRRCDTAWNVVLAIAQAIHWFNPFFHLAARRFRASRELVRDHDALSCAGSPTPNHYATALLDALERARFDASRGSAPAIGLLEGNEWRKRIIMIRTHGRFALRHLTVSASLVGAVGTVVAMGAAARPVMSKEPSSDAASGIRVESFARPTPWLIEVEKKLANRVQSISVVTQPLEAVKQIGEICGFSVDVVDDSRSRLTESSISLHLRDVSAAEALDVVARLVGDVEWVPTPQGVQFNPICCGRYVTESRFYALGSLLDGLDGEARDEMRSQLVDLLRYLVADEQTWNRVDFSIGVFRQLLVVRADAATHAQVRSFLEQLEQRKETMPNAGPASWLDDVQAILDQEFEISFESASFGELVETLGTKAKITIVAPGIGEADSVHVRSGKQTLRALLSDVASQYGTSIAPWNGAVLFCATPKSEIGMFEIGEIVFESDDGARAQRRDELFDMVRSQVRPGTWDDSSVVGLTEYRGLLIVRQSPEALVEVRAMLGALTRAMNGN